MLRIVFFLMMAAGLAGFGTVAWLATRPSHSEAAVQQPVRVTVLSAAHAISAGSLLKPDDFSARIIVPEAAKSESYMVDSPEARRELLGAMTRKTLSAGDLLRESDVIRPGDHGFLAAALKPGMRAVTINIDAGAGAGELIGPGDRVDLILTQSLPEPSVPASRRVAAETVLSDVRVLAIDQKLVLGASAPPSDRGGNRTVTLEVTESQAQRLSVAMQLGHLSISIRSAEGVQAAAGGESAAAPAVRHDPGTVWAVDVSPALGATQSAPPPASGFIRVFQGAGEVKEFKF